MVASALIRRPSSPHPRDLVHHLIQKAHAGGVGFSTTKFSHATLMSGADAVAHWLGHMVHSIDSVYGSGEVVHAGQSYFCDICEACQLLAQNSTLSDESKPKQFFADAREMNSGFERQSKRAQAHLRQQLWSSLVVAGPSCVDFSTLNWSGADWKVGESGECMFACLKNLENFRPGAFLWENVKACISHLGEILNLLTSKGYVARVLLLQSSEHYLPQSRQRVYIVGCDGRMPGARDRLDKLEHTVFEILMPDASENCSLFEITQMAKPPACKASRPTRRGKPVSVSGSEAWIANHQRHFTELCKRMPHAPVFTAPFVGVVERDGILDLVPREASIKLYFDALHSPALSCQEGEIVAEALEVSQNIDFCQGWSQDRANCLHGGSKQIVRFIKDGTVIKERRLALHEAANLMGFSSDYYRLPLITERQWKRMITNGFACGATMAVIVGMLLCFDLEPTHEAMERSLAPKIPQQISGVTGVKQKAKRRRPAQPGVASFV